MLADVPDAYNVFGLHEADLWQQVKMVQDPKTGKAQYFVDLCGVFGSVYAGDQFDVPDEDLGSQRSRHGLLR